MHCKGASKFPHAKTASRIGSLGMIEMRREGIGICGCLIGFGAERGNKRRASMGGRVIFVDGWECSPPVSGLLFLGNKPLHGQFAVAVVVAAPTGRSALHSRKQIYRLCWHRCGEGGGCLPEVAQMMHSTHGNKKTTLDGWRSIRS